MPDPSVVSWQWCWFGLVIAACGAVLALHGVGQRRPSAVERTGLTAVALGAVLLLGPPLVNGTVMLLVAVADVATATVAAAHPSVPGDRSPDH